MKKQIQNKLSERGYSKKAINNIFKWYIPKTEKTTQKKSISKKQTSKGYEKEKIIK